MKATPEALEAAHRLWEIANGFSGQCKVVAQFLLGIYNGREYPFDLTNFRGLDAKIFMDCVTVLAMDYNPEKEIHEQLGKTDSEFERLAKKWNISARECNYKW